MVLIIFSSITIFCKLNTMFIQSITVSFKFQFWLFMLRHVRDSYAKRRITKFILSPPMDISQKKFANTVGCSGGQVHFVAINSTRCM